MPTFSDHRGRSDRARVRWSYPGHCLFGILLTATAFAFPVLAAERELDQDSPPRSARDIETPIERVFPEVPVRPSLFPWVREQLQKLPPFFADTQFEARYRSYYLRKDRTSNVRSEALAMGGSLYYRSGWLEDLFAVEIEGFTSQPIHAPSGRGGTLLLNGQNDYSALGIANGKLRYKGIVLTGFRQYLDLPYVNRQDSRMTPNTFESLTVARPEGELRFTAGYTWKIKRRNSDEFVSMTEAVGLDEDRGLTHAGAVWDPNEDFHVGAIGGIVPDLFAGIYGEPGLGRDLRNGWETRLDGQFTYQWDIGDDLLDGRLDDTWNLGIRASASYAGAVIRLGLSLTGADAAIASLYGTNPTYVDLMQQTFNRADEKALLASVSYDFSGLGVEGFSVIVNFVAGFDGKVLGVRNDAQELDVTLDYRASSGWLESFWLRVRGSWITEEMTSRDGSDIRVILRYTLPVI